MIFPSRVSIRPTCTKRTATAETAEIRCASSSPFRFRSGGHHLTARPPAADCRGHHRDRSTTPARTISNSANAKDPTARAHFHFPPRTPHGRTKLVKMIFAEYITTLATALTIFNVYSTTSVSAPIQGSGAGRMSFRSLRRWRRRTITSSGRIYLTMAVPYVAATVLVNNIAAEEVVPIYIAAVASVSGRFNKGQHTVTEWMFKTVRTMTILWCMFLFMIFKGINPEKHGLVDRLYNVDIRPEHAILCLITSWRWFVILIIGLVTAPLEQAKTNSVLACVKIALMWLLLEKSGKPVMPPLPGLPSAWTIFDSVIVVRTPLRNLVFALYTFLIVTDALESVVSSLGKLQWKQAGTPGRAPGSESDDGEDPSFDPISVLRSPELPEGLTFDEFWKYCGDKMWHLMALLLPDCLIDDNGSDELETQLASMAAANAVHDVSPVFLERDIESGPSLQLHHPHLRTNAQSEAQLYSDSSNKIPPVQGLHPD